MKTILLLSLSVCFCFVTIAQNVSINTSAAAPEDAKAMLEIRKPNFSKLKIRTDGYSADTTVIELSNRTSTNVGTAMFFSLINEEGLLISTVSDLAANAKDSLLSLKINGNMGFGIRNPAYNYHFHTPGSATNFISITSNTTGVSGTDGLIIGMSAGNGVINNLEGNSLRLGTANLTRLAIDGAGNVGIGNLTPGYKLDVNGDINVTGLLRMNGSAGTAGQVLTSNGASDPQWKDASFANNTRFGVAMTNSTIGGGTMSITATEYNLNTTDITIGTNSITINKTGLYHFNGNYYGWVSSTASVPTPPEFGINLNFTGGFAYTHQLDQWKPLPTRTATSTYFLKQQFSQDFYIIAPTTLQVSSNFLYSGAPIFTDSQINLFGYRISD